MARARYALALLLLVPAAPVRAQEPETCFGQPATITGTDRNDSIRGTAGPGNDVLTGASGPDRLRGGEGDDTLYGGGGRTRTTAGPGRTPARARPPRAAPSTARSSRRSHAP